MNGAYAPGSLSSACPEAAARQQQTQRAERRVLALLALHMAIEALAHCDDRGAIAAAYGAIAHLREQAGRADAQPVHTEDDPKDSQC